LIVEPLKLINSLVDHRFAQENGACPGRSEQLMGYKTQERILFFAHRSAAAERKSVSKDVWYD
jgi:hypothetical protein